MQIFLTSLQHSRRSKNHPILFLLLCCPLKKGTNSANISTRKTTIKQGSKLPSRLFTVPRDLLPNNENGSFDIVILTRSRETCSSWNLWFEFWQSYPCVCPPRSNSPSLSITSSTDIPISPLSTRALLRIYEEYATQFEGGWFEKNGSSQFFPQQTEQQREIRIKEKTLSIPSHPEIIAPYSNNADRYAFPKQKKRERNKKRMQNCEKDAISV